MIRFFLSALVALTLTLTLSAQLQTGPFYGQDVNGNSSYTGIQDTGSFVTQVNLNDGGVLLFVGLIVGDEDGDGKSPIVYDLFKNGVKIKDAQVGALSTQFMNGKWVCTMLAPTPPGETKPPGQSFWGTVGIQP